MIFKTTNKFIVIIKLALVILTAVAIHAGEIDNTLTNIPLKKRNNSKDWTFIVYIAADNDLRGFAARNIKQMAAIGSSNNCNICVELHIRISGNKKITRRYFIEHNKILHVNAEDPSTQKLDSGDPKTLIGCCDWAIKNYPARNYALILWNHGTGICDPSSGRIISANELFTFNPLINKLELDRSIGFLDFIQKQDESDPDKDRGICWDDSTGNYLNNQKLDTALRTICSNHFGGGKFSIIGFDACLMSMLEVANIVKKYAHIMVGSQEVELGYGWNYELALQPFKEGSPDKIAFAQHLVHAYQKTYNKITNDYTLSAINLDHIDQLERNVNNVAQLLQGALRKQKNDSVKSAIRASHDKGTCTHFDEPSYIDLHHFFSNLRQNLTYCSFNDDHEGVQIRSDLDHLLEQGCSLIQQCTLANATGKNLSRAQGISVYMPDSRIHHSYRKTNFAATNSWMHFLQQYLAL